MKRRRWIILAAVLVAGAAAVAGAIGAIGRSSDNASTPSGRESILRIQPAKAEVPCGELNAVYVYLDDLADRPSPREANFSYGVAAFEFLLRYDPKVVRIAKPIDAELNPELDREDILKE